MLVDERYGQARSAEHLSKWVRNNLEHFDSGSEALGQLDAFFRDRAARCQTAASVVEGVKQDPFAGPASALKADPGASSDATAPGGGGGDGSPGVPIPVPDSPERLLGASVNVPVTPGPSGSVPASGLGMTPRLEGAPSPFAFGSSQMKEDGEPMCIDVESPTPAAERVDAIYRDVRVPAAPATPARTQQVLCRGCGEVVRSACAPFTSPIDSTYVRSLLLAGDVNHAPVPKDQFGNEGMVTVHRLQFVLTADAQAGPMGTYPCVWHTIDQCAFQHITCPLCARLLG